MPSSLWIHPLVRLECTWQGWHSQTNKEFVHVFRYASIRCLVAAKVSFHNLKDMLNLAACRWFTSADLQFKCNGSRNMRERKWSPETGKASWHSVQWCYHTAKGRITIMRHYTHLTPHEREKLFRGLNQGKSISQIARELSRNKSTISREVRSKSVPGMPGVDGAKYSPFDRHNCLYSTDRIPE